MSLATFHSQIEKLQKEILDLDNKILLEQKKIFAKKNQIDSVNRTIGKNITISTLKSKTSQILRYSNEINTIQKKINDYEKQNRTKKQSLLQKAESLRKDELAIQKKQQQALKSSLANLNLDRYASVSTINHEENTDVHTMEPNKEKTKGTASSKEIFVSYSWDTPEHEERVLDFTNHLRGKGFTAVNDKMLNQEETAINFVKMMYQAMNDYSKIIVVLSKGYKEKADGFKGGVGQEYELMINDLNDNPNKYILASFEGRSRDVIPAGLKGRDIVDLSDPKEENRLFAKLMGHKSYAIAEVAKEKPVLPVRPIKVFAIEEPEEVIVINEPIVKATGDAQIQGGKYKFIEFSLGLSFKNNTRGVINGFAYHLKLRKELDPSNYYNADSEGYVTHQLSFDGKLYPKQNFNAPSLVFRISNDKIHQIIGSVITVIVYTDQGPSEREYLVDELIKIKPGLDHWRDPVPISVDLFI